jgi:hypothetical protein
MKNQRLQIVVPMINCLLWVGSMWAQAPEIEWQRSLGGSLGDAATSVVHTQDGGFVVAGQTSSDDGDVSGNHGLTDFWVVKLNAQGEIEWQKTLGGSLYDEASQIKQTKDLGYIVIGLSSSSDGNVSNNFGNYDFWIVKLDASGNIQWEHNLGGSESDTPFDIIELEEGGYVVLGSTASNDGHVSFNHGGVDYWVVHLNAEGFFLHDFSLGGTGYDMPSEIKLTLDGNYILVGTSNSTNGQVTGNHGNFDFWVVKLSPTGSILWEKSLGGSENDFAYSVNVTEDGGYIVAGISHSNDGDVGGNYGEGDIWVVKLDAMGNIQWEQNYGGSGQDEAKQIQTIEEGYVIVGSTNSLDGDVTDLVGGLDYWLLRISQSGELQWQQTLGGSNDEDATGVQPTTDRGYILAGRSRSSNGDVSGNHGSNDFWVVKMQPDPLSITEFNHSVQVYPNPASQHLFVQAQEPIDQVIIYNTLGQPVMQSIANYHQLQLDISQLPAQLYMVVVKTMTSQQTFKILVK